MVLVTGATGILGRVIVLELLKQGRTVRATHRKNSDLQEVRKSFAYYTDEPEDYFQRIEWAETDFEDLQALEAALHGVSEVYHCSGKVSFYPQDRQELIRTNTEGTKNLLYACEGSSVQKFLFVSSVAVLDGFNEDGFLDETSDYNPKIPHSYYAKSKHFSEMEVSRASAEGLNTIIVNPGIIIGSGNWQASSGELFSTLERYPYAMGGTTSYVDVRDVARISVDLMNNNRFGERFILMSENRSYLSFSEQVRSKLGKSLPKVLSATVLKAGYVLNILMGWLFPRLRLLNKINIATVTGNSPVSNKKIKTLGYEFIPVSESIDFHLNNYQKRDL